MSEFGTIDQGRSRTRALVWIIVVLGVLVVVTALLWRDLGGQPLGGSLDDELADFPAPSELTPISDMRTGSGAPLFGERPGRWRVYASDATPERTCELLDAALARWQVDAGPIFDGATTGAEGAAARACAAAGPRRPQRFGSFVHVRVTVLRPDAYAELMAPGSREWPVLDPLPEAVATLQLTRVGTSGEDADEGEPTDTPTE